MKKTLAVLAFITIIGGALAGSKQSDAEILTRVGRVAAKKVKAVMPDASALAGPLVALTPPDLMPVADRVRLRIKTDSRMNGVTITVTSTAEGDVTLRGEVASADQRRWAVGLAQDTAGVKKVIPEFLEPGK